MQVLDVVLPEAKTNLQDWHNWQNRLQAEFISYFGKKIEVKYIDTSAQCVSWLPMETCKAVDCNWFKHSQVGMR